MWHRKKERKKEKISCNIGQNLKKKKKERKLKQLGCDTYRLARKSQSATHPSIEAVANIS